MQSVKKIKLDEGNASAKSPPKPTLIPIASVFSCIYLSKMSREHLIFLSKKTSKKITDSFWSLAQL